MARVLPPIACLRIVSQSLALGSLALFSTPSAAEAQSIDYGMFGAIIYQDNFVTPMPDGSGTFVLGTLPGGNSYSFAGKSRDQILADFKQITGSTTTIYAGAPGQLYVAGLSPVTSAGNIPTGTQLFCFFSTGSSLTVGNWCVLTGTDSNWLSPNPADPFGYTVIELSAAGNRICAGTLGWRYRNGNQTADNSWTDDLGFVSTVPVFTSSNSFTGTVGVVFSNTVTASGSTPISFGASNLPAGLTISTNGLITGTPTTAGTNTSTLTASNAYGVTSQSVNFTIASASRRPNSFQLQSAQAGSTTDIDNLRVVDLDTGTQVYTNSFSAASDATNNLELFYWPQGGESTTNFVRNGSMTRVVGGKLRLETTGFNANGAGGYESHSEAEWGSSLPRNFLVEFDATRLQWAGHFHLHFFRKEVSDSVGSNMSGGAMSSTRVPAKRQDVLRMAASGSWFQQYGVVTNWNGTQGWAVTFPAPGGSLQTTRKLGVALSNSTVSFYLDGSLLNSTNITALLNEGVGVAAPVLISPTTAVGRRGSAFSYSISASNNPTSYGATGLPPGLSVNASTGVLSGTPTQAGLFSAEVSASNAAGTATGTLLIGIGSSHPSSPVVTGPSSATGYVNSAFSYAVSAQNNPSSFSALGLPLGVELGEVSGAFRGAPLATGTYRVLISAANASGLGVAEMVATILAAQPPPVSNAFVDVGMVSGYVYTNNGTSALLGGSFGLGYFASAYDFASKSREQILSDITWMGGSLIQGGLIDAANPGQFYLSSLQSQVPLGTRLYALLSTGPSIADGNWFVLSGTEQGGWLAPDPDGLSSTSLDLGYLGNTILAGTSGWRFASGGLTSTGDESIVFSSGADTTPPLIALLGDNPIDIYRGGSFADPGATVTDNVDAARTIYGSGAVDTSTVASYTLTYSAQDAAGNAAIPVTRTVNVVLNPSGDEDNDGLTNAQEATLGTSPYLSDSDGDGLTDAWERGFGRYQVVPGNFTWDQAKTDSEARGGHLATITGADEWNFVKSNVQNLVVPYLGGGWLGGWQQAGSQEPDGGWQWVTGEAWSYTAWNIAPDNAGGIQDAVRMFSPEWDDMQKTWSNAAGYVLEYGYPTDPTKADTDSDGYNDSVETHYQSDPNNAAVTPNSSRAVGFVSEWINPLSTQYSLPSGLTNVVQVAAGGASYALKSSGSVVAWGGIWDGSTVVPAYVPSGITNAVQVDAGINYALILKGDGTVSAWGNFWNGYGHQAAYVPQGLNGVVQISAGISHAAALKADGSIVVWGANLWGELNTPVGMTDVVQVEAGGYHTMALKRDGSVVVWGGIDSAVRAVPANLSGVKRIAAGGHHCVALKSDGTVVAWGRNNRGQVDVPSGLSGVTQISAAPHEATIAVRSDGTVASWGDGSTLPAAQSNVISADAGWERNLILVATPPDATAPLIALLGSNPITVYRGGSFTDPGATVTDNVDATRTIYGSGAVDTSAVGSYTLTYSTQDATGNAATPVTRIVNVILNPAGDEDNDGLTNAEEATLGTSPYLRDTDSDGATDYREVGDGTNPLNAGSFNPLSKGLVAYYPFEGSANDLSGNKHNGSLIGSTLAASGPTGAGESLHIDGSNNSWMEIADTPELRPAGTTVSVWIYNNRSDNSEVRFVCGKDFEQMEIHLGGNPLNPQSGVRFIPINGCYVDTLSGVPTNQWYHLLCVAGEGSGGAKVYINGQKANVLQSGSSNGSQPLGFGTGPVFLGRRANGWSHLDGRLDNFRIYNRVLSDSEIKSLYFQESGGVTGVVGQALSEPVGATAATGLPPGLTLNAATGVISGVPTSPGLYEVKLTGQDGIERTRQFNILRASQSAATVDIGMVAARLYADYFGTTLSGGSFGLGVLPGGSAYNFTGKTRDQILSDFVWVNGSRINGQLVGSADGGQFYVPSMTSSFDPDLSMYAFLSTGATTLDGNWLVLGGPDVSWLTPDADNPLAFTVMELSLAGNRIYAGTDGWRYRNGVLVSTGDEDLGFIAPPVVTGGMAEATQAEPFSYQIEATENPVSYDATGLPAGLIINPATGIVSGASTQRGVFNVTLSASNAGWTRSANLQLTVKLGLPVVTNPGTQSVKVGAAFNYQVQANNEATAYAAQGLPAGLSINATTGLISGRATQPGTYPVVVSATNTSGTGQASFELNASYDEVSLAGGETTFEVIEKNLTWHQAKADAEALGGRLAVFPTGDMYDRVIAEVRKSYAGHLWLGLTDEQQEGLWTWLNTKPLSYDRWRPGQPDNNSNEDYAHVWAGRSDLNDLPNSHPDYPCAYLLENQTTELAALPWSQSGMAWTFDTTVAHDGISSAKVQTTDGQSSYREYTVSGPKVVDFWWKVSSEQDFDFFAYSIDGVKEGEISGNADWEYRTVTLGAGEHTLRWTYTKDELGSVGSDAGWVDGFATYPAVANLEVRSATNVLTGAATIDFGSGGGTNVAKNLTFLNRGYVPMDVQISLAQDAPFSFRDGGGKTYELHLERGEEVDLELVMDTSTIGTKTAVMTIEAPDSQTPAPTLTLTGIALGGEIALYQGASAISHNQPTPVDLGFAPSETVFTVANEGNASNLLISDISVSSGFLISQMPSASVPPGGTTSFKVVSLDSQPGLRQGAVTIACNDLDNQVFVFPVQAKVMFGTGNQSGGGTSTSGAGGAAGWDFATATLPSGQAGQALKTGATPHGGSSSLQGVFSGPGMLTWKWQVATQQGFDWLVCEVNGAEVAGISTKNAAWQSQAIRVPAGATVRWIYRKDASGSVGEDSGYVADLNFQKFNAGSEGYEQWAARTGNSSPDTPNAKTGLPAIFGWLGAWDPSVGPGTNHYRAVREAGVFKYRFPVSKTATGNARVEFSTDLRFPPQSNSWSARGLQQSVHSEDGEKSIIEVTAPSHTKGFFRLIQTP